MFVRPEETEPVSATASAASAPSLTDLTTSPTAPVPVTTVAPEPSTAHTSETIKAEYGKWIVEFGNKAEPIAAMLLMSLWTHFGPAFLVAIVPTSTIEVAINKVFAAANLFVQNQSVSFSVPTGWVADAMHNILTDVPDLLQWIETEVDPIILAQMKALGVIPA